MNPRLSRLQPYPFEKLRALLTGIEPPEALSPIRLSIGEPQHAPPPFVLEALTAHLGGLAVYPATAGTDALREALADWFVRRYGLPSLDPSTQVLPVNGSREALFAFAQAVVDSSKPSPAVVAPNPFYQIYEGAALLAGADPIFINQTADADYALDLDAVSDDEWARTQLIYVCSPGNPSGHVFSLDDWARLFERSDRHGFAIASDECYSEIYFDESQPPLGALEAAVRLGRQDFRNIVVFTSLSKRSNLPGLRSGAVAGDARLLKAFLLYRTYHGCAMSPAVQQASMAAWRDEVHVRENRDRYREKFQTALAKLGPALGADWPQAGFYLWTPVRDGNDEAFCRELFRATNVTVLPGTYLARASGGKNPGAGRVRIALVPETASCAEAVDRITRFAASQPTTSKKD